MLKNSLTTFLKLQKTFQSEQILFSSILNIFEFSERWDFWGKKITEFKIIPPVRLLCDNIVCYLMSECLMVQMEEVYLKYFPVQVIDSSVPSSQASFKRNITAVLFNFNFLKS